MLLTRPEAPPTRAWDFVGAEISASRFTLPIVVKLFTEQEKIVVWGIRLVYLRMDNVRLGRADLRRPRFVRVSFRHCDFTAAISGTSPSSLATSAGPT
jgi:hypothetical protein